MTPDEITCRQLVDLVTEYFEGTLDDPTLEIVEQHLIMCDGCQTYVDQMRVTISVPKHLRSDEAGPAPSETVLAALRARRTDGSP